MIKTSSRGKDGSCFLRSANFNRVVDLGVTASPQIDFNRGHVFKCDTPSSGSIAITVANRTEGKQAALHINEVASRNVTFSWPAALKWITAKPDQLDSDSRGVFAIECFDGTETVCAWKQKVE